MNDWLATHPVGQAVWVELEFHPGDVPELPCGLIAHVRATGGEVRTLVLARSSYHPVLLEPGRAGGRGAGADSAPAAPGAGGGLRRPLNAPGGSNRARNTPGPRPAPGEKAGRGPEGPASSELQRVPDQVTDREHRPRRRHGRRPGRILAQERAGISPAGAR